MVTLHPPVVGAYCSTSVKHETPERVRGLQCAVLSNIAAAPLYKYTSVDIVKISAKTLQCDPGSSGTRSRAEQPGTPRTHENPRPASASSGAVSYGVTAGLGPLTDQYRETRRHTARTPSGNGGRMPAALSASGI